MMSQTSFRYTTISGIEAWVGVNDGRNRLVLTAEPAIPFTAESLLQAMLAQGINAKQLDKWNEDFSRWDSYVAGQPFNNFNVIVGEEYWLVADVPSWIESVMPAMMAMVVGVMALKMALRE